MDNPRRLQSDFFKRPQVYGILLFCFTYFGAHQVAYLFPDAKDVMAAIWPAGGIGLA